MHNSSVCDAGELAPAVLSGARAVSLTSLHVLNGTSSEVLTGRGTVREQNSHLYERIVWRRPLSAHPLYGIWSGMMSRCHNENTPGYRNYGGRGIRVCDEWRADFLAFASFMGPRPSPRHSVDRIDNDEGYGPNNCRWADPYEQARNKRTTKRYRFDDELLTLSEWATIYDVSVEALRYRISGGMKIGDALQRCRREPPPRCIEEVAPKHEGQLWTCADCGAQVYEPGASINACPGCAR